MAGSYASAATSKPHSTTLFAAGCASATTTLAVMAPTSEMGTPMAVLASSFEVDKRAREAWAASCCASVIWMAVSATKLPHALVTVPGQVTESQSTLLSCSNW